MPELALRPSRVEPVALRVVAERAHADVPPGAGDVVLTGATVDSRQARPGDLFGALPGEAMHGATFAAQAVASGAVAILTDAEGAVLAAEAGVPVLIAEDAREAMGWASVAVYDDPSRRLALIGVTGTNGKTTTSFLIEGALSGHHSVTGLMGTVEARIGAESRISERTTVEAPALQAALALMVERGATAAVTEASSQAIALERVTGTHFAVALFTNLQYEHLDFHHTMEEYFAQKARIFAPDVSERGVILIDDEWGRKLAREATIPVETVGTRADSPRADWNVDGATVTERGGMAFTLIAPDGTRHAVVSPLPGAINVSNAAGAVVAAHAAGVPIDDAIAGLARARPVPGRTEVVTLRDDATPMTVVDYAHTPDGLAAVLDAMRGITPGRVIVVFGCDGLRDDSKRPGLGQAAATHADIVIVTDENPRTESPGFIRSRILAGVDAERPDRTDVYEIAPRSEAVLAAMRLATPADTVITTGKGHETTQEIDGVHYPYTDAGAFRDAIEAIAGERA